MLLLSTAGVAISYALWVNASSFKLFVLARIIGGLSKGNVSLATAIVADVSGPKTRQRGMALIGIAFSIGFLVGPLVGAGFSVWAKGKLPIVRNVLFTNHATFQILQDPMIRNGTFTLHLSPSAFHLLT